MMSLQLTPTHQNPTEDNIIYAIASHVDAGEYKRRLANLTATQQNQPKQ